jgi:hypothetical protein
LIVAKNPFSFKLLSIIPFIVLPKRVDQAFSSRAGGSLLASFF